jgi:RNA polymerase sigma-70 factor (ECF subfamily)
MGETGPELSPQERVLPDFERARRRLFGVAYRMLGSIAEAEDIVQDAFLRWSALEEGKRDAVDDPTAYLVTVVTRLCIDALRSAHARRMTYVGPWLPEPLLGQQPSDLIHDPSALHASADDLSVAFLVMMERLSPVERAVLLLKESFGFSYKDIAGVVDKGEDNCRQIQRRARMRLKAEGRTPQPVDHESHERLLRRFLEATRGGDVEGLVATLVDDVVSYADGGGKVVAAKRPVSGALNVARYLTGLVRVGPPDLEFRIGLVNGEPGILTCTGGRLRNVVAIAVHGGRIGRIYITVNPDKLAATQSLLEGPLPCR